MNTLTNSVRLVGNLGMDPEVKSFDNNRKLAKIAIATNETYKNDKGEKVTDTQWHNLVLWGAQVCFLAGASLSNLPDIFIFRERIESKAYSPLPAIFYH